MFTQYGLSKDLNPLILRNFSDQDLLAYILKAPSSSHYQLFLEALFERPQARDYQQKLMLSWLYALKDPKANLSFAKKEGDKISWIKRLHENLLDPKVSTQYR